MHVLTGGGVHLCLSLTLQDKHLGHVPGHGELVTVAGVSRLRLTVKQLVKCLLLPRMALLMMLWS